MNDKNKEFIKNVYNTYNSDKVKILFANLITFETIIKLEYSEFLNLNYHESIFNAKRFISTKWIVKNIPINTRKIIAHLLSLKNKKTDPRKTIIQDFGTYDDFYDGEYETIDLGNDMKFITMDEIFKELTFGETLSIILKIKTIDFVRFLKEKYSTWKFNEKTTKIVLHNIKLIRNRLFHIREVDVPYEMKRQQKFNDLFKFTVIFIEEWYNINIKRN